VITMINDCFIPWAKPDFWGNEQSYVAEALTSTWISGGPFLDRFESDFAQFFSSPYALTASNGTTALHMAYLALGLKAGDDVILPGFAFMGAANMALYLGARPVFADVNPQTWCLSVAEIEKYLTARTKLIVPIHTYGNVCEMDSIMQLADSHGVAVVEDVAEAFACRYKNRLAGTFGDIGTFSFQATKTITTGEGGMVITNNENLYDRMALYRSHGMRRKQYYWHDLAGHNFRLTNLQAAVGVAQMEKLEHIVKERKRVYNQYQNLLANLPGLTLQYFPPEVDPVIWAIAVKLDPLAFPQGRDSVIQEMIHGGIETRPGFVAPRFMDHIYVCPALPISEELSKNVLSLPTYPTLRDEQICFICDQLQKLRR
jgi:perosamine synthetase